MLVEKEDVLESLRCPKTGSPLFMRKDENCTSFISAEDEIYHVVKGYPILIDFAESILRQQDIKISDSVIKRSSYIGLAGSLKHLVSPPKKSTAHNVKKISEMLFSRDDTQAIKVLIIGGGTIGQGMNFFYENPNIKLVAFDIYGSPYVQFIADAHRIPLADESFDAAIIQAVLEHVIEPQKVVSEIHRVLRKDGIVYAETPFLQHVHEGPYDFTRFTESGHRYLFKDFNLIDSGVSAGAGTQLLWSLDNFFRGLFRSQKIGKVIKLCFFWIRYFDSLIPESFNVDAASGVFFLGTKGDISISKEAIVAHYKGAQTLKEGYK